MNFIKRHWNYFKDNADANINISMSYRLYTLTWLLYTLTWLTGVALVAIIILHKITQH